MDKTLAEIVAEISIKLIEELAQIEELRAVAVGGPAEEHAARTADTWHRVAIQNAVEQASTRTKLAIQNAIVRM